MVICFLTMLTSTLVRVEYIWIRTAAGGQRGGGIPVVGSAVALY